MQNAPKPPATSTESLEQKLERRRRKFEQYFELIEGAQTYAFRLIALIFLIIVEIFLFIALFTVKTVDTGLVTAITIIALLPIVVIRAFDISVLNLSKEGAQIEMIRDEMDEVLSKVDRLFALAMSEPLYKRLLSLTGGEPCNYKLDEDLRRQLYYLVDIGCIEFTPTPLPTGDQVEDLRSYAKVTKIGKDFIEVRARVSA